MGSRGGMGLAARDADSVRDGRGVANRKKQLALAAGTADMSAGPGTMPSGRQFQSGSFGKGSTAALVLLGFLALLGIVAMTFWLGERAGHYYEQAIEARDARAAATELRHALESAESSQRGFLLTGNQIYLAPF